MSKPKSNKRKNASTLGEMANRYGYAIFGRGVVKGNPERCLHCRKPIQAGDEWTLTVSPTDPKHGAYTTIAHVRCNGR
jgi:hypothetical protein